MAGAMSTLVVGVYITYAIGHGHLPSKTVECVGLKNKGGDWNRRILDLSRLRAPFTCPVYVPPRQTVTGAEEQVSGEAAARHVARWYDPRLLRATFFGSSDGESDFEK